MKADITRIKIKLKGREIELTTQEAREVQKELNKLFEVGIPYSMYPTPVIIEQNVPHCPRPGEFWYFNKE
jgi:hypothetical protein